MLRAQIEALDPRAVLAVGMAGNVQAGYLHVHWAAHPQIAYDADQSVLRLEAGERIWLNADDFEALCSAFLAAMRLGGLVK